MPVAGSRRSRHFDLNRDGFNDLLFQDRQTLKVLYGSKRGLSASSADLGLPLGYTGAWTADLDGDGYADVIGQHEQRGPYVAWSGPGRPPSQATLHRLVLPGGSDWESAVPGDFNGDGAVDLAAHTLEGGKLGVFYGPFTRAGKPARHTVQTVTITDSIDNLVAGDLAAKRATDLLAYDFVEESQQPPTLLKGGPRGLATEGTLLNAGSASAFGDFDGDGLTDVVTADSGARNDEPGADEEGPEISNLMTVYYGSDRKPQTFTYDGENELDAWRGLKNLGFGAVVAGDLNHDGLDDLAAGNRMGTQGTELFYGSRKGLTRPGTMVSRSDSAVTDIFTDRPAIAVPLAIRDHDGDGKAELILRTITHGSQPSRLWIFNGTRQKAQFPI
ncbi:FG-GAP repeat domain-containing protein [Streptosporangium canum]|uniref:FG-GAP repeat domain-containing protein n=1 Tax=Streptosporangium canum TaxID=324952 RepID=UPI0036819521